MTVTSRIFRIVMALALGCVFLAGIQKGLAAHAAGDAPSKINISIDNFSFTPSSVTVAAGTTVTWINKDDVPHTVVSDDKTTFRSKALDTDEQYSYTFTKPGTYDYFCSVHPRMTGEIVVK